MSPFVELTNVSKSFPFGRTEFPVLKNINIHVDKGECICVLGPSGCGKTILLYLIAGFLQTNEGEITVDGQKINTPSRERMMVFQDYVLFPWRNVIGNIRFGLENIEELNREQKQKQVEETLQLIGMQEFAEWPIHKLSGGMQQKVAIARALATNPKLLLMDEPFSAIDPRSRQFFRESLLEIWAKTHKTIIFVTHSITEALFLADRIYLFSPRPAHVLKEYGITIPRPRQIHSSEFQVIHQDIYEKMGDRGDVHSFQDHSIVEELTKQEI